MLVFASTLVSSIVGAVYWLLLVRVTGLAAGGGAAGIVSAALIPGSVLGLGLGLAAAREAAAAGGCFPAPVARAVAAASLAAGLLGYWLSSLLGSGAVLAAAGGVLAGLSVSSAALFNALLGLEAFAWMLYSSLAANAAKLAAGLSLGFMGYGVAAYLAGFLLFNLVLSLATLPPILSRGLCPAPGRRLLALAAGNTVDSLATQLPAAVSVYLYALLTGAREATGALYLGMMTAAALAMLPTSLARATLARSIREGREMAGGALAAGLAAALPPAALVAALPGEVFSIVSRDLASPGPRLALSMLAAASTLLAAVNVVIVELNRRGAARALAALGAARLAAVLSLLPLLTARLGLPGASLAYALSLAVGVTVAAPLAPWAPRLASKALAAALLPVAAVAVSAPLPARLASALASVAAAHLWLYPYTRLLPLAVEAARRAAGLALRRG